MTWSRTSLYRSLTLAFALPYGTDGKGEPAALQASLEEHLAAR